MIPYPIFFGLITLVLYLLGIPFMIATGNLHSFLSEQKWAFLAILGFVSGTSVIFVFRRFQNSLNDVKHLMGSEDEFQKMADKLLGYLTNKIYWISVAFWPLSDINNLIEPTSQTNWWWFYNQAVLVSIYYFIEGLPVWIFGGVFFYMIPFGLTLAYRELCLKTSFKEDLLVSEWMEPFKGFKSLITLTMLAAVAVSIFPFILWVPTLEQTATFIIAYASITLILIPTILFPHYFFHKLFSRMRSSRLKGFRRELLKIHGKGEKDSIRKIRLLLEKWEMERMKTWLIDVKVLGEILVIALMHVILIEVLTTFIHG